jgi:hypothetical protein
MLMLMLNLLNQMKLLMAILYVGGASNEVIAESVVREAENLSNANKRVYPAGFVPYCSIVDVLFVYRCDSATMIMMM